MQTERIKKINKERNRRNTGDNNSLNFSEINDRQQNIDQGRLENTGKDRYQKNLHQTIFELQKTKPKTKSKS